MICPACQNNLAVNKIMLHVTKFCMKLTTPEDRDKTAKALQPEVDVLMRDFNAEAVVKQVLSGEKVLGTLDAKESDLYEHGMNLREKV